MFLAAEGTEKLKWLSFGKDEHLQTDFTCREVWSLESSFNESQESCTWPWSILNSAQKTYMLQLLSSLCIHWCLHQFPGQPLSCRCELGCWKWSVNQTAVFKGGKTISEQSNQLDQYSLAKPLKISFTMCTAGSVCKQPHYTTAQICVLKVAPLNKHSYLRCVNRCSVTRNHCHRRGRNEVIGCVVSLLLKRQSLTRSASVCWAVKTSQVTYNNGEVVAVRQLSMSHCLQIYGLENKRDLDREHPGRQERVHLTEGFSHHMPRPREENHFAFRKRLKVIYKPFEMQFKMRNVPKWWPIHRINFKALW